MNKNIIPVELNDRQLEAVAGGAGDPTVNVGAPNVNVGVAVNVPVQVVVVAASTLINSTVEAVQKSGATAKAGNLLSYANQP